MLDELLYVFLRALEFDGDDPLPLITEWNYAIARVQKVFERMTDKDAKLVEVIQNHDFLESLIKPCWIPVTETPPLKVGDDGYNGYLVYTNGYYAVADYTTDKFDNVPYFHVNGEYEPFVTHFMPLPDPPKEEKQ